MGAKIKKAAGAAIKYRTSSFSSNVISMLRVDGRGVGLFFLTTPGWR
jgi:hypothetical protein